MDPKASWEVEGDYFEGCNCNTSCRCVYLDMPDEGHCDATVAWHIEKGHHGSTTLDGLNVLAFFHSPGHMVKGPKWSAAVYLDARAKPDQAEALGKIFSGQAGGHPGNLAAFIGEVKGVRSVPITFEAQRKRRSVRIPEIIDLEIDALEGGDPKQDVLLSNPPLSVAPGFDTVVSRSRKNTYRDHGFDLNNSGKNGFYSRFRYKP